MISFQICIQRLTYKHDSSLSGQAVTAARLSPFGFGSIMLEQRSLSHGIHVRHEHVSVQTVPNSREWQWKQQWFAFIALFVDNTNMKENR